MSGPITLEATTVVPDLRIVLTNSVVPHEHHDWQRLEPLIKRIDADGNLKNPPIVAELGDDRYVVLDGANRVTALSELDIPHCLVQVVPYEPPFTELQTWHHAITDIDINALDAQIAAIDDLTANTVDLILAQAQLARRVLLSYYVRLDGSVVTLESPHSDLHRRTTLLNKVVSIYLTNGRLHRTNSETVADLKLAYPDFCALMIFPSYEPVEILELAGGGERIPPGLTRHIIQGRAMRVNYSLDDLRANTSLEDKNVALTKWLQDRLDKKRMRFYAESTFLFDE
jgi:hypothetical protein